MANRVRTLPPPTALSIPYARVSAGVAFIIFNRHLTDFQKAELGHVLKPIERELAQRCQVELAGTRPNTKPETLSSNELEVSEQGQARDIVARKVGLSPTTYQHAKTNIEKAPEEQKEKVRSGETSLNYAYKQIKEIENDI